MEGLNDELSMQLMVATFNNYQELVDKALMIEGKQQQIESRKRKYGQGRYNSCAQQKPRLTPTREDLFITMEATHIMEEVTIIILAQGMEWEWSKQQSEPPQSSHTHQEKPKPRYLFQVREDWTLCHGVP